MAKIWARTGSGRLRSLRVVVALSAAGALLSACSFLDAVGQAVKQLAAGGIYFDSSGNVDLAGVRVAGGGRGAERYDALQRGLKVTDDNIAEFLQKRDGAAISSSFGGPEQTGASFTATLQGDSGEESGSAQDKASKDLEIARISGYGLTDAISQLQFEVLSRSYSVQAALRGLNCTDIRYKTEGPGAFYAKGKVWPYRTSVIRGCQPGEPPNILDLQREAPPGWGGP